MSAPREIEFGTSDDPTAPTINPLASGDSAAVPSAHSASVLPESLVNHQGALMGALGEIVLSKIEVATENERDRRRRINMEILEASDLISPESSFRKKWDVAQILLLAYVAMSVPYRLGFDENVELWSFPWFWVDLCVDIYFITDLFVSMRTAFYDSRGDMVVSKAEIHKQYMQRPPYWFAIDLLACFPGSYIEWYLAWANGDSDSGGKGTNANKMLRMLRLLRLLKLLRLLRLNRLMARYEEEMFRELHSANTLDELIFFN